MGPLKHMTLRRCFRLYVHVSTGYETEESPLEWHFMRLLVAESPGGLDPSPAGSVWWVGLG